MKEKIKNFLLKIKNSLCCEIKTPVYKLMLFGIIMMVLSCICFSCYNFVNSTLNDNSNNVENVETELYVIDRDIKGANPTQSDYVPNYSDSEIGIIYFNTTKSSSEWFSVISNLTFYNVSQLGLDGLIYPIAVSHSSISSSIPTYGLWILENENIGFPPSYFIQYANINTQSFLTLGIIDEENVILQNQVLWVEYVYPLFENVLPIGTQNQLLWDFVSTKPFESSSSTDIDTSSLTLNETNFDRAVYFSTFLTKETIAGYFSQLTYETTNFITPSLTLNGVDSYTIITGRIGSVPIANYIPSLVVVKYESKYVVYNYLRDNYLTPIYDTSTGVLDNVLGDGIYFLDVSSPTYFGSQNDKINLFISAINIADSPLYSLISIGYTNGYDFGYGYGYNSGYQVGFGDGEESGYNEGYDTGFENGFVDGRDTANPLGPVMSLFKGAGDVLASVFNVQILPNVTIGIILLFPIVALLFALFVRLFFGG